MNSEKKYHVCPVKYASSLDNRFRKLLHNPQKILRPYIKNGMRVLDVGCGPGFFSFEMAKMVGETGSIIAADLQEGMLLKLKNKIKGTFLEKRIELHKCDENKTGITGKVDFIFAFYVVHEVPDKENLFKELHSLLNPDGRFLLAEPKLISKNDFNKTLLTAINSGFEVLEQPKIFFSHSVILKRKEIKL